VFPNHTSSKNKHIPQLSRWLTASAHNLFLRGYLKSKIYINCPHHIVKKKKRHFIRNSDNAGRCVTKRDGMPVLKSRGMLAKR
jgi:hypothetical protein